MLFDTGYGEAFMRATQRWPEALYRVVTPVRFTPQQAVVAQLHRRGIEPTAIRTILLSHLHGDHVGGLHDFPAAEVWCAHAAWQDMQARSRLSALSRGLLPELLATPAARHMRHFEQGATVRLPNEFAPFGQGHDLFGDGSLFAVPLPGHAPGHFGVCFRHGRRWVFLVGDAAWSTRAIAENLPPPAWATAMLGDTRAYRATLADLHALSARHSGVMLVPAHCRTLRP